MLAAFRKDRALFFLFSEKDLGMSWASRETMLSIKGTVPPCLENFTAFLLSGLFAMGERDVGWVKAKMKKGWEVFFWKKAHISTNLLVSLVEAAECE